MVKEGNIDITGTIYNNGTNAITSYEITYSIDKGASSSTYSVTGVNIPSGTTHSFTHIAVWTPTIGKYNLEISIGNVNNNSDKNSTNNVKSKKIFVVKDLPVKRVVTTFGVATWSSFSPRVMPLLDSIKKHYPDNCILIVAHSSDIMSIANYTTELGMTAYPSAVNDRGASLLTNQVEDDIALILTGSTYLHVNIINKTWDETSRILNFDVEAEFSTDITEDLRFNAIVVEDSVTGSTSDYNQANYYTGDDAMAGVPDANPILAADMIHELVARNLIGGFDGTENSIPASVVAGSKHSQAYSYTVPAEYDIGNIIIVGMVIDQSTGAIVNANKWTNVAGPIVKVDELDIKNYLIYPNPSLDQFSVKNTDNATVTIISSMGTTIKILNNINSTTNISVSELANGIYFVKILENKTQITKKLIINR
ncbi:MAG: Omp28-related outer membrane protein [Bacteroidota bacterium]|nr:Omp28-related outer membrane protein [Bacteroidota bacterium]